MYRSLTAYSRQSGSTARGDPRGTVALAPCQERNHGDLWFSEHTADVERAKSLCASCPLRVECLAGAVERAEPWGVWGGQVFIDGLIVARKRGRGRPRKGDAGT